MRHILGLLGAITAAVPDRIIAVFETMAIDNPSEVSTRPWLRSAIRLEGLVILAACLRGGRPYRWLLNVTGVFGAIVLVAPDVYRRLATELLYDRPDRVEWNEGLTPMVRVIGAGYVLLALGSAWRRRRQNGPTGK